MRIHRSMVIKIMSIQSIFESPNTPLNELFNAIAFAHPNIKSRKIRILKEDSHQLMVSGVSLATTDNKSYIFMALDREIELPISATLTKHVLGADHSVVKMTTYIKITSKDNITESIDMITSVPVCFAAYARGREIVTIKPAEKGSSVSIDLRYTLQKSEEEGSLLKSFGFSISGIVNGFLDTLKDIIVTQYSAKRQLQFGNSCPVDIKNLKEFYSNIRPLI